MGKQRVMSNPSTMFSGNAGSDQMMDKTEFRHFLTTQGINLSDADFEATWRRYDADGSGRISLAEFQKHVTATSGHHTTSHHTSHHTTHHTPVVTRTSHHHSGSTRKGTVVTTETLFRQYSGHKGHMDTEDVCRFFSDAGKHISHHEAGVHMRHLGSHNGTINQSQF